MNLILTGDLHFTDRPNDAYRFDLFPFLRQRVKKYDVGAVILLGDITDFKDQHPATLVNRIVRELVKLAELCPVYIIRGNHDCNDPNHPFFQFLDGYNNIYFYTHPESVILPDGKTKALFLPHSRQPSKDWQGVIEGRHDYIFCHQTFRGCRVENGTTMQEGLGTDFFDDYLNQYPDCQVFSGDIHVPQKLGPITYAGAPYHIRFGDKYDARILLLKDGKRINMKLKTLRKHTVTIEHPDDLEKLDADEGDQIKVHLSLPKAELVNWQSHKRAVMDLCEKRGLMVADVRLETKVDDVEASEDVVQPQQPMAGPSDVLRRFCSQRGVPQEYLDAGLHFVEG